MNFFVYANLCSKACRGAGAPLKMPSQVQYILQSFPIQTQSSAVQLEEVLQIPFTVQSSTVQLKEVLELSCTSTVHLQELMRLIYTCTLHTVQCTVKYFTTPAK